MDYKEKYEQALERAKEWSEGRYGHSVDDTPKDIAEYIFPELKESKDERIRKALIHYFDISYNIAFVGDKDIKNKDIIAWLEKQGEHANFLSKIQIGDKVTRNKDGVLVNLSQLKRIAKSAEEYNITGIGSKHAEGKLGEMIKNLKPINEVFEQKPTCWSDEEVEIIDWLVASLDCLKIPTDTFYQSKARPFLISLRNKIQPIIKEWNEDDESLYTRCLGILGKCKCGIAVTNVDEELNWLKSLKDRVQPQREWSEEDEGFRNLLIAIMKVEHPEGVFEANGITPFCGTVSVHRVIDWLKSLRPQSTWKPSEEQMDALESSIVDSISSIQKNMLNSLYNDLKKL